MTQIWHRLRVQLMRPWTAVGVSIAGLMLALIIAGVVLIRENERVLDQIEQSLTYDIEIEDEGDDLRVAVLDLRHFQRNIMYDGPSAAALAAFDQGYASLREEITDLEPLGLEQYPVLTPDEFSALATTYYSDFRQATSRYDTDRAAFDEAANLALMRIEELDREAEYIDDIGERLAATSLERIQTAASQERLILFASTGGIVIVGIALAVSAWRLVARSLATSRREQQTADQLARALRSRTDFIADASHELRTPLTVIQGNAELGLTSPGEPIHQEVLEEIVHEATRMSRLVDDLLFMARSDAGRPPLAFDYVSARWLVERLARPAETLARQRGSCLETVIDADGFLEIDPGRIEQAVLILVDNATRHSPAGVCVRLEARVVDDELTLAVIDRGEGIPFDQLPLIFDRFHRAGQRKQGAAGLGLAIAKAIVEAHGGSISAESRVGAGTTMTIRLPLVPAVLAAGDGASG